jgi:3-oxoacyl-[acyl-carrier-protein] synthase II
MNKRNRVVVTGLGVATPVGLGIGEYWDALLTKRSGIKRIEAFDPAGFGCQIGGELPPFKFGDYIPKTYRKSSKVMARDIVIAVICAYYAVKDAGLATKCIVERGESDGPSNVDSTRFGANIGAGLICADLNELAGAMSLAADEHRKFSLKKWGAEGMENLTPLWLLKFLPNMLACHVTIVHDAQAPSNTITCGEASSHLAIGEAFRTIARGDADVCICGGAESKINPMAIARPHLWNRINRDGNDRPESASQPFAADRHGMVPAEGGGLVILESLEHARKRDARIYAELVGFGSSCNTKSWTGRTEDDDSLILAMEKALADAAINPQGVDLVCACGMSEPAADAAEMSCWSRVFGERLKTIPAMTVRGAVGNNGAGTGAIDFATTVTALYRRTIPPSINTTPPDDQCRLRFVQDEPVDADVGAAMTVAYAMSGGQNAALLVRRFEE